MNGGPTYNERAWAIDLIGHLKQIAKSINRPVKEVGGEQSVKGEGSTLFPDVLLFGDKTNAMVLQGWELKMPDTGVDDAEFVSNAEKKARLLGLSSFVLWNVSHAKLYVLNDDSEFVVIQQWSDLSDIKKRDEVLPARERWEALAGTIFMRVNELLETGEIEGKPFVEAYRSGGVTELILAHAPSVADALEQAARKDVQLRSAITLWWDQHGVEYGGDNPYFSLAQANLINWIGKLLFANILRQTDSRAGAVGGLEDNATPADALALFDSLARTVNFWTIFSDNIGLGVLTGVAWAHLTQLNNLLSDLNLGSIHQRQLSDILEATVAVGIRRLRGQYTTPHTLARLLIQLTVQDFEGRVLDPCCGSGTIARAAIEQKLNNKVDAAHAAAGVFAGDLDPQALQLATLALAKSSLVNQPLRLFLQDAFTLKPQQTIDCKEPNSGKVLTEQLGTFHAIASNLPFVGQDGRQRYGNAIGAVNQLFDAEVGAITGRADVSAYLPFALHQLLEPGGRLGIIITNAWLGTAWGDDFRERLGGFFRLKTVITSGAGRWFQNSKVVTNILILEKPKDGTTPSDEDRIDFVVLKRPIEEMAEQDAIALTAAQIEMGQTQEETLTIRSVTPAALNSFANLGLAGSAQFVDVNWVLGLPLVPVQSLFTLRRGERRGWNPMFYPAAGHGIESDYIRPSLRSSSSVKRYITTASREAFSCSLSIADLTSKGHTGALAWIARFQNGVNGTGVPLVKSLQRAGHHWYEMRADEMTEIFASINYGDRLYFGRLNPPAFADQRLMSFKPKDKSLDVDLSHALLNSAVGLFMLEGIGFGRGLGALDLNKDRIGEFMHALDPARLDASQIAGIKQAFAPLCQRDIMEIADELEQDDRREFDTAVLTAFGQADKLDRIYESLLALVAIRQTATT